VSFISLIILGRDGPSAINPNAEIIDLEEEEDRPQTARSRSDVNLIESVRSQLQGINYKEKATS
jgi:hypothetical protein